jgi:hypothetical protein
VLPEATGLLVDDEPDGLLLLDDAVGLLLELLPVPDEAVLPGLRQGLVLPVLDEPMLLVSEPVAEPVLELVSAPVVEPLEVDCACTANEAIASAAPAATTANLWVLVMSEVLWLRRHAADGQVQPPVVSRMDTATGVPANTGAAGRVPARRDARPAAGR